MVKPWEGFWQVLYDKADEDVVPFRNTTIAVRKNLGFVVFTRSHFMEIEAFAKRQGPVSWPPAEEEAVAMFRAFRACAGYCDCREVDGGWMAKQRVTMASDPRLEGTTISYRFEIDGDICLRRRTLTDGGQLVETLRRLSCAGTSALAGAWESGGSEERWMYLVTAGHYGVMRVESNRPRTPSHGGEFSDTEVYALWKGFGANAGARLETKGTFDHWPMIAQVAGYEVRKHETFHIDSLEENRLVTSFPPDEDLGEAWRRID
ncbi:MAG TPA: hypothetical protein VMS77_00025 [Conexivisphaerales archaeon]|nr:hypothetical protein [Conexivisphaerales archaeon]